MQRANLFRANPAYRGSKYQRGQALIYGIFMLMASLTALFFLFNTGQLSSEKTKLVNTADAVAYSAAVMHARALNFDAYNNRALVANEVLVAQMVSLSSWAQYAQSHADNLVTVFPECADPNGYGAAYGALFHYGPFYAAMCYLTVQYAGTYISQLASYVPQVTEIVVFGVEANKAAIKAAQALMHAPFYFQSVRGTVMQQVADRNYAGNGAVIVEPASGIPTGAASAMTDDWRTFTKRHTDGDRTRFAEVAKIAAYSDDFVKERSWTATALLPPPTEWKCVVRNQKNSVKRRGGTELIGLDEWKAEDTESFWRVRNSGRWYQIRCRGNEEPIAWGEQQAHPSGSDEDESGAYLGGSPSTNPQAHSKTSSSAWTGYTGLPSFYDLSPDWLAKPDPRLKFAVRVIRNRGELRTSEGASPVRPSPRLNNFNSAFAGDRMTAVATGEVYFERPPAHEKNTYAVTSGSPNTREIGSLFNPYWQVRLVANSAADVALSATP